MHRTPLALACAGALVAACARSERGADSAQVADSAAAAAAPMTPAAPAAPALTDANIVAMLDGANVADSSTGSLAAVKGTSAAVKTFGRDMMREHHAMHVAGLDLAKTLNITPQMPAGDNSAAGAAAWRDSLNAMPRGAAWDKAYIDHEVADHQAVLNAAQTALAATQNAELKAFIQKAATTVQAHLDRAKQIESTLK